MAHTFSNPSSDMSQLKTDDIGCLLGIQAPWKVSEVTFAHEAQEVQVHVSYEDGHQLPCPECGSASPGYDHRRRQWRHLDLCAYRTIVVAQLPRVECPSMECAPCRFRGRNLCHGSLRSLRRW